TPTTEAGASIESSANDAVQSEPAAPDVLSESQTSNSSSVDFSDAVMVQKDDFVSSSSSISTAEVPPPTQKPQVPIPSGVREELPMIDWT
ncbi:hypothetical protein Tco_1409410, partial [Tanacetum coccineum]